MPQQILYATLNLAKGNGHPMTSRSPHSPMARLTTRVNSVILSLSGLANATALLALSRMSHCSESSRCYMPRLIFPQIQLFREMLRRCIKSRGRTWPTFCRSVPWLRSACQHLHWQIPNQNVSKSGRIYIGFDGWTSPNVLSFLGVVVHYAHEGKSQSFTLDFIMYVYFISFLFMPTTDKIFIHILV